MWNAEARWCACDPTLFRRFILYHWLNTRHERHWTCLYSVFRQCLFWTGCTPVLAQDGVWNIHVVLTLVDHLVGPEWNDISSWLWFKARHEEHRCTWIFGLWMDADCPHCFSMSRLFQLFVLGSPCDHGSDFSSQLSLHFPALCCPHQYTVFKDAASSQRANWVLTDMINLSFWKALGAPRRALQRAGLESGMCLVTCACSRQAFLFLPWV